MKSAQAVADIAPFERSLSSIDQRLDSLHKELYDLQKRMLNAPRKVRKQLKAEAEELDTRISQMCKSRELLGRSRIVSKGSNEAPDCSENDFTTVDYGTGLFDDPGTPSSPSARKPDSIRRLDFDVVNPYETSSDEGSNCASGDDELDANYSYHQQLMGYTNTGSTSAAYHTAASAGDTAGEWVPSEMDDNATTITHTEFSLYASSFGSLAHGGLGQMAGGRIPPAVGEGALPPELAFFQNFSFMDEMAQREEYALREELGIGQNDELPEELNDFKEEWASPSITPAASPMHSASDQVPALEAIPNFPRPDVKVFDATRSKEADAVTTLKRQLLVRKYEETFGNALQKFMKSEGGKASYGGHDCIPVEDFVQFAKAIQISPQMIAPNKVETMYSDYAVGHLTKQLPRSMFVDCIVECVFSICQDWEEADRKLEILVQML